MTKGGQQEEARARALREKAEAAPFQAEWDDLKARLRQACSDYNRKVGKQVITVEERERISARIAASIVVLRIDHYEKEIWADYTAYLPEELRINVTSRDTQNRLGYNIGFGTMRIQREGPRMIYEGHDGAAALAQDELKSFVRLVRLQQHPEEGPPRIGYNPAR